MTTPSFQTTCPGCGKSHTYSASNPNRPFCCERCKLIDLGRWANEEYSIPTPASPDDETEHPLD